LNVINLDEILAKLSVDGFFAIYEPQKSEDGTVRVCYLKGFEGILLELVEKL